MSFFQIIFFTFQWFQKFPFQSVLLFCFISLFLNFATELQKRQKCCQMFWFFVWAFSSTLKIKTFETTSARSRRAGKISLVLNGLNNHQIYYSTDLLFSNFRNFIKTSKVQSVDSLRTGVSFHRLRLNQGRKSNSTRSFEPN